MQFMYMYYEKKRKTEIKQRVQEHIRYNSMVEYLCNMSVNDSSQHAVTFF